MELKRKQEEEERKRREEEERRIQVGVCRCRRPADSRALLAFVVFNPGSCLQMIYKTDPAG